MIKCNDKVRLTDLLDLKYLQQLQDSFASFAQITTAIVAPDGSSITRASNWHGLCALFRDSAGGSEACLAKIRELLARGSATGEPEFSECPHGGTLIAAMPIIVDDLFLGSWVFSQMRVQEPPEGTLKRAAAKAGLCEKEVGAAFESLPAMTSADFARTFIFMRTLSGTLNELSQKNLEMALRDKQLSRIAEKLTFRDRMLTQFVHNSSSAMYISDFATGEILMVNQALGDLVRMPVEEIPGRPCHKVLGTALRGFCGQCPRRSLLDDSGQPVEAVTFDYHCQHLNLWLQRTHQAFTWHKGRLIHMAEIEDTTHKHAMREQLESMAFHHRRTGLPNANKLAHDFTEDLSINKKLERFMVCLDLSSLRLFCDAYGATACDKLLKAITAWLLAEDFGMSGLYHLSGYEFCLLLRNADATQAEAAAAKISTNFETPWQVNISGHEISYLCGVSVGILHIPPDLTAYSSLMDLIGRIFRCAEKNTGIFVYDEEADRKNRERIRLILELKDCVDNGMKGFSLQFQPIAQLSSGTWKGLEALCRWKMADGSPVSPVVFIYEAERLGLINIIGAWVLENAVRQAKELGLDAIEGFFMSVNISPIQMMDETFADTVAGTLKRHDYPGSRLNLEVTESERMTFNNFTVSIIEKLRSMDIRMALDDFGTGYSSFNNLKHLPVDFLKTEREFILGIEDDAYMQYFFFLMSELAHINKMKLIAEGVETPEQLAIVKNNGADYIQGYLFSKPLSAAELHNERERFHRRDQRHVPKTADVINIRQWLSGKSAYELTPSLFNIMNQCAQIMLAGAGVSDALQRIFDMIGRHLGVSRVFAFTKDQEGRFSNRYEWCAEGAAPHHHLLQRVPLRRQMPSLFRAFKKDGMVIASNLSELADDMRSVLAKQDVSALALLPLWQDGRLVGFVGFDNTAPHEWAPEEVFMLWNLSLLTLHHLAGGASGGNPLPDRHNGQNIELLPKIGHNEKRRKVVF